MLANVHGRDKYIDVIKKYAESNSVGNQAFLGVKGVGKTSLFQHYFTKKKKEEIAAVYKKLFVFSRLDSRKQGSDLYRFLLDQVKIGIREIPNEDDRNSIKDEMKEIDDIFEDPDSRLTQYLTVIKEMGYDLVLIMDQFHCMARDTEIGSEQYDVLRSFNEQKLITYWIITDTDLMETCATKQYIASFFAQKFTSKLTICPIDLDERENVVKSFMNQKKCELTNPEIEIISHLSGGIPELMSILLDLVNNLRKDGNTTSEDIIIQIALSNDGCISLFNNWISGLNTKQKELLYIIADMDEGMPERDAKTELSKLAELSDDVGRGLLHVKKEGEKIWEVNNVLFRNYILSCGTNFYEEKIESAANEEITRAETQITNIYNIEGNLIQSQTNNILNIENAVAGLEDLQRLVRGNPVLLDETQAMKKLDYLPFRQEVWSEMDEDEQEEELEKYADGIFSSEIFSGEALTQGQMDDFLLSEQLLGDLSETCKGQIVCGIQVYNLIQICIDRFGLSMSESESPRGILFARAFEKHLKDYVAPSLLRVPEMAVQKVYPTQKAFKDFPLDKTTIGTYSGILKYGYRIFAKASTELLGYSDKDELWWKQLIKRLEDIGELRNNCCHSGTTFGNSELCKLKNMIFADKSLYDILLFGEIPQLRKNHFSIEKPKQDQSKKKRNVNTSSCYPMPDISLIGKTVDFKVLEKTSRGTFRGIVNGVYEGSLPKSYASKMDFMSVKNKVIKATTDKIQDGKYVMIIQ